MDKQEKKGLAIGAVIGAIAGVVTGILFAPKSGKETRQGIKDEASKINKDLRAEIEKLQKEAKVLIAKVEAKAKSKTGIVATTAKKHVKQAKHSAESLATVVKSFNAGESSDKDLNAAIKKVKAARTSLKAFLKK